ncbi:preprotein translocase subunit SecD [Haematobacter missouriensis]|uniref:Protein translocase subunit SecD n=1 Tax=Haematobacter missouriensis TaxID=366616 RepID=A0A212AX07_9RHOB|nr:protein translocase subunit SecD [Haematobacter missouriensis]KFI33960.1 preprotein translocase subunit SecD [Haematobacter missouriensis]OWJ71268.1 protein translocase subunit SecD [Haematobacter missouriensis]OWJ85956.1 protein translocase subunit SecD [Haematobacter missouriensis]
MLHFPLWKRILIWVTIAIGIAVALPNAFYDRVERHNDAVAQYDKTGQATDPETVEALSLWPSWMPSKILNLGLDLRGGAHLLAEVHLSDVYAGRIDSLWPEVRDALVQERATVGSVRRLTSEPGVLQVQISQPEGMPRALEIVRTLSRPVTTLTGVGASDLAINAQGDTITVQLSDAERHASDERTMAQSLEIVRRRVDEVGTREPTIVRQGDDRILIQVPGLGSADELKGLIGTTARLTFNSVVGRTQDPNANPGPRNSLYAAQEEPGVYYIVQTEPVLSGDLLTDAQPAFDQNGRPAVNFRFNATGARVFGDYTATHIGQPFAIVLDEKVISAPVIQSHIAGGSGIITGNFSVEGSTELAVLLRAGALPAKMTFLEERTIGPELGQDSIDAGRLAATVAMIAVMLFMVAGYGFFGMIANVALILNLIFIIALMSLIGATLTMPGIAGIVLTIGMAVDANVLILERVREELRNGTRPARAIELGYEKASSAIMDANVTTLMIAVILFALGSGPVRGFAVTLALGLVTSLFTAVSVTRLLISMWYDWRRPKTLKV